MYMEINEHTRMCSFDTGNMYTSIPKIRGCKCKENMTQNNPAIIKSNKKEIINILKIMLQRILLPPPPTILQTWNNQPEGLALDAPTSAILAKAYIVTLPLLRPTGHTLFKSP